MSEGDVSAKALRKVMQEMKHLEKHPPEGIIIQVQEENISSILAQIVGPDGTPFQGGVFRVKLRLGSDFPQEPPKGFFLTKIFHPNVGENGEICVNTLKKDWDPSHGVEHVLLTIKCLLIAPNPESALNDEAGKLLLENYEDYAERARLLTSIHASVSPSPSSSSSSSSSPTSPSCPSCGVSPSPSPSPSRSPLKKKQPSPARSTAKKKKVLKRL